MCHPCKALLWFLPARVDADRHSSSRLMVPNGPFRCAPLSSKSNQLRNTPESRTHIHSGCLASLGSLFPWPPGIQPVGLVLTQLQCLRLTVSSFAGKLDFGPIAFLAKSLGQMAAIREPTLSSPHLFPDCGDPPALSVSHPRAKILCQGRRRIPMSSALRSIRATMPIDSPFRHWPAQARCQLTEPAWGKTPRWFDSLLCTYIVLVRKASNPHELGSGSSLEV